MQHFDLWQILKKSVIGPFILAPFPGTDGRLFGQRQSISQVEFGMYFSLYLLVISNAVLLL